MTDSPSTFVAINSTQIQIALRTLATSVDAVLQSSVDRVSLLSSGTVSAGSGKVNENSNDYTQIILNTYHSIQRYMNVFPID